ncbi:MAG: TIGR04222 domain-containing membrane protein [Spirulinaceae cyanobacterium]
MDAVFNNPLAQMYGPYFLLVYGAVIGVVLTLCHNALRDRTAALPVPKITDDLDPYEVAYLRGGENAIAQLIVGRLVELGYWEIVETTRLIPGKRHPEIELLNEIEKRAFEKLTPRRLAADVRGEIARSLTTEPYQQSLEQQNLLTSAAMRQSNCWIVQWGAIAILGLV